MRRKNKLLFTKRKHPLTAIFATILGAISLFSLFGAVLASFLLGGEIPGRFGAVGMLSTLYALVGIVLALSSLQKPDIFRFFGVLGAVLNAAALLVCGFLLWIPV